MAEPGTLAAEIASIPGLVRARLADAEAPLALGRRIASLRPRFAVTIGRGSSDAVCEGLARSLGTRLGLVTASLSPSLVTIDRASLRFEGALALAVSQSGRSPDLIEAALASRAGGAFVVGLLNVAESPLASACHQVVPVGAFPEHSVAATRSVVLSWLSGLLAIEAAADPRFDPAAWSGLAPALDDALTTDWAQAQAALDRPTLLVLGRGAMLATAREFALKCKELAGIAAEAISSAEVLHGPRAAVGPGTSVLGLGSDPSLPEALSALEASGASVLHLPGPDVERFGLPPSLAPLVRLASLYPLALALSVRRGRDPDRPRDLTKVTLTR